MAGATTNRRSCPLLSLEEASAIMAISLAEASGAYINPDAVNPPNPNPIITPLSLRILLIWLSAGCNMLNRTHAMAGIRGSRRAKPRLSPSAAISAICWAANAGSDVPKVAKTAPAMAVLERKVDKLEFSLDFDEIRPFGRFWRERREIGLGIIFWVLWVLVELMLVHLTLSTAIVAMVAAIEVDLLVSVELSSGLWQVEERCRMK